MNGLTVDSALSSPCPSPPHLHSDQGCSDQQRWLCQPGWTSLLAQHLDGSQHGSLLGSPDATSLPLPAHLAVSYCPWIPKIPFNLRRSDVRDFGAAWQTLGAAPCWQQSLDGVTTVQILFLALFISLESCFLLVDLHLMGLRDGHQLNRMPFYLFTGTHTSGNQDGNTDVGLSFYFYPI